MLLKTATLGESKVSREVKKIFLKVGLVGFTIFCCVLVSPLALANGGGWTGSGSSLTPSGTPGGSYGSGNCNGDNAYYLLGCTGFSWMYYKYIGGAAGEGRDIRFRPYNSGRDGGVISGECAGDGKGFWHFGRNARGFSYNGYGSYNYVHGYSDNDYVYSATPNLWGHMESYTYGTYINYSNYYDWSNVPSNSAYYMPGGGLGQTLYSKIGNRYVAMYEVTKLGSTNVALNDYAAAYEFMNGSSYSGSTMPAEVYAFCYWDDMREKETTFSGAVTLKNVGVDTNISKYAYLRSDYNNNKNNFYYLPSNTTSIKVGFNNKVTRTDDNNVSSTTKMTNYFYYWQTGRPWNSEGWIRETGTTYDITLGKGKSSTKTGTKTISGLKPGDEAIVCERINYGVKVMVSTSGSNITEYKYVPNSDWLCVNLKVRERVTLTGVAVDVNGNRISGVNNVTKTVDYGAQASITRPTVAEYTFKGWKTSATAGSYTSTGTSYTVNNLTSNRTIYAVYEKNSFQGRARVFEGSNTSGTNSKSTGWVDKDNTQKLEINCSNNGCTATFDLYIRTTAGNGATSYAIYRSYNGGNNIIQPNITPAPPTTFSTSGTVLKINGKGTYVENLRPGESVCYLLMFRPHGTTGATTAALNVCAEAKTSTFQGKTDAGNVSTGWQNTNNAKLYTVPNCPVSGCNVTFTNSLRRTTGGGSTNYTVSRTSNYWVSSQNLGVAPNNNLKSGTENFTAVANGNGVVEYSETVKLVPGQIVCEAITFKPSNASGTINDVTTRVCASALGNAQPSGSNLLNMEVKNDRVSRYNSYQKKVYAKPQDVLTYRATYNPILQYTYHLYPQALKITCLNNATGVYKNNSSAKLGIMFNNYRYHCSNDLGAWKNGFSVESSGFSMTTLNYTSYAVGDTRERRETNTHTVSYAEVGKTLGEIARTNLNNSTKTTPSQVTFTQGTDGNTGNVIINEQSSNASAIVPYNFTTSVNVSSPAEGEEGAVQLFAGEQNRINYQITVMTKRNSLTMNDGDRNYATRMDGVRYRMIVYQGTERNGNNNFSGDNLCAYYGLPNNQTACGYSNEVGGGSLHTNVAQMYENVTENKTANFYVQDLTAGTRVCVAAAVYPSTSGADGNIDPNGSRTWNISDSKCYTVAKRPSLQVLGGNVYSGGRIKTGVSIKNNLAGRTGFSVGVANDYNYVFGSWGELGVIAGSKVTGFSSGAGTGYPEGSRELRAKTSIFLRSTLTFGNYPYSTTEVNGLGVSDSISNASARDRAALIRKLGVTGGKNVSGAVSLNDEEKKLENGIYYYNGENDNLTIGRFTINKGTTQAVRTNGNVVITGNLEYAGPYNNLEEVPKLIIYAKNIVINCVVNRVDAVLIAEKTVVTCENGVSFNEKGEIDESRIRVAINDRANSNQLKINGAIIANKLILNRTYGAATGINSIIPAEIINYDSTLYLWGSRESEELQSNKLTPTYLHDMAPRL